MRLFLKSANGTRKMRMTAERNEGQEKDDDEDARLCCSKRSALVVTERLTTESQ